MYSKTLLATLVVALCLGCATRSARLTFAHGTSGADVRIDKSFVGHLSGEPQTFILRPGRHSIFVEKRGYSQCVTSVNLLPGCEHVIVADLTPHGSAAPVHYGHLEIYVDESVVTMASPISVYINGVSHGQIWSTTSFDFPIGTYRLRLTRTGSKTIEEWVLIDERIPFRFVANF